MSDRMYRITAMGVMDLLRVEVDMYDLEHRHTTHIASAETYVERGAEDDFLADVAQIAVALRVILNRPEHP